MRPRNAAGSVSPISSSVLSVLLLSLPALAGAAQFQSAWPEDVERAWIGAEYWANRLQDWRISQGRLECVEGAENARFRTVHLLTRCVSDPPGALRMSVRLGPIGEPHEVSPQAAAGFLIGAGGRDLDYRAAALVHHGPGGGGGLMAGIDGGGWLFIGEFGRAPEASAGRLEDALPPSTELVLTVTQSDRGRCKLTLAATNPESGETTAETSLDHVEARRLTGSLGLFSHPGAGANTARWWFRDWKVSGSRIEAHDDRALGPIVCTQYTLSNDILKMTAQMMPVGDGDTQIAELQIRRGRRWRTVDRQQVVVPGYTVPFRVENWDSTRDTPYRVVYDLGGADGRTKQYVWSGTVRRDPVGKGTITVAAFTGNANCGMGLERAEPERMRKQPERGKFTRFNLWFPHADLVRHVKAQKPDLLVFTGDQVYEGGSPTRAVRGQGVKTELDYMYKWYLWCWAYRDLARDIPTVCLPDDHDVYQGNIWGWSGRPAPTGNVNSGGYTEEPAFVNMVQRTQTSHLPDPYDPTPVEQGIGVYYTALNCGGISFAIIEDRKFKSPPTVVTDAHPNVKIRDGHIVSVEFDTSQADVPGATLLGDRQLEFLRDWAADWRGGVEMKAVLSQTIFANLQTRDQYPDKLDRDLDSNGWPQTGRAKALHEMRRAFAFHIAGDQHLASIIHHGIDDWDDACWSFCVPSIANYYLRFWQPPQPGGNHRPGMPGYTGEYRDGLGNRITVWAVANPERVGVEPSALHDRAPGYGLVKFNKATRKITIECWPRYADPTDPQAKQYPGWPLTIAQEDNYGRKASAYLPTILAPGEANPLVQVIDQADGEVVYTLRIRGSSYRPKVFKDGLYTVKIGEPGTPTMMTLKNVEPLEAEEE
ncbi:MAG: alkaline phosphatase D family protein [Armatimonadota bacterium]